MFSSCRASSTDLTDSLAIRSNIIHHFQKILLTTSSIRTKLLEIDSSKLYVRGKESLYIYEGH